MKIKSNVTVTYINTVQPTPKVRGEPTRRAIASLANPVAQAAIYLRSEAMMMRFVAVLRSLRYLRWK